MRKFVFFDIVSTCICFLFQINGENVVRASHDRVVQVIRHSGDTLALKVVTVRPQEIPVNWQHTDGTMTLPIRGISGNKKQGMQITQYHNQLWNLLVINEYEYSTVHRKWFTKNSNHSYQTRFLMHWENKIHLPLHLSPSREGCLSYTMPLFHCRRNCYNRGTIVLIWTNNKSFWRQMWNSCMVLAIDKRKVSIFLS